MTKHNWLDWILNIGIFFILAGVFLGLMLGSSECDIEKDSDCSGFDNLQSLVFYILGGGVFFVTFTLMSKFMLYTKNPYNDVMELHYSDTTLCPNCMRKVSAQDEKCFWCGYKRRLNVSDKSDQ